VVLDMVLVFGVQESNNNNISFATSYWIPGLAVWTIYSYKGKCLWWAFVFYFQS